MERVGYPQWSVGLSLSIPSAARSSCASTSAAPEAGDPEHSEQRHETKSSPPCRPPYTDNSQPCVSGRRAVFLAAAADMDAIIGRSGRGDTELLRQSST